MPVICTSIRVRRDLCITVQSVRAVVSPRPRFERVLQQLEPEDRLGEDVSISLLKRALTTCYTQRQDFVSS